MTIKTFTFRDVEPMKIGEEKYVTNKGKKVYGKVTDCKYIQLASGFELYNIEVTLNEPITIPDKKFVDEVRRQRNENK